jgi:hypothetical protein
VGILLTLKAQPQDLIGGEFDIDAADGCREFSVCKDILDAPNLG